MDTRMVYSSKAEKYAKYRWDYTARAIETIFEVIRIPADALIADIGAGTGILTRHFTGKVKSVFAVEPNAGMRQALERCPNPPNSCVIVAGTAEDTTLPDGSIDLITIAQAIHWFDPEPARREFLRILKPNGWLAILRNYGTNTSLNAAVELLYAEENGVDILLAAKRPIGKPAGFYYGNDRFRRMAFPFSYRQDWEGFIGSLISISSMPDEDNPLYKNLENAARKVFAVHSKNGWIEAQGETELYLGQPAKLI